MQPRGGAAAAAKVEFSLGSNVHTILTSRFWRTEWNAAVKAEEEPLVLAARAQDSAGLLCSVEWLKRRNLQALERRPRGERLKAIVAAAAGCCFSGGCGGGGGWLSGRRCCVRR